MERVSIIEGKKPIIIVAPHGYAQDDERTATIAEAIANTLGCYAVINRGWERDDAVDIFNDKADCNNVEHCQQDVVKEEFLEPILRFRNRIRKKHQLLYLYMIHGMSNKHRTLCGDSNMDVVIGFGAGSPDSFTCDPWRKDAFIYLLGECGLHPYEGKKGGAMSGWARQNMNQLFRKWYNDPSVQAMQIEIINELRSDNDIAQLTAEYLASAMDDMLGKSRYNGPANTRKY